MTSAGGRRGRRDNGLVAAAYAAAGDVDPRVGEHLLDVLGLRGIAAYLQPASDMHPVTRTTTLPSRPTDRLYVDRAHLETAREYLAQLGPDTPPESDGDDDIDRAFAAIVAGFDLPHSAGTWPEAENLPGLPGGGAPPRDDDRAAQEADDDGPTDLAAATAAPATDQRRADPADPRGDEPSLLDRLDALDAVPIDDEEGYTPPPPPPLPRFAPMTILAVALILVGAVLLFDPGLLPAATGVTMTLGFAGIVAGFVMLIWRLRSGDDDDDWDPSDGAVV